MALAFEVHAPLVALAAVAGTSLVWMATCLRRLARRERHGSVQAVATVIAVGPPPPILRFPDTEPRVFCSGLLRARVFVSTGALFALPNEDLRALLAHQRHHAVRRDPLRLLVAQALADGLPFFSALRPYVARYAGRLEAAAVLAAETTEPASSPGSGSRQAVDCPVGRHASSPHGARSRTSRLSAVPWLWGAGTSIALGALVLHAGALLDLSALDSSTAGGQLCLVVIVTLLVLGAATAFETDTGPRTS